MNDDFTDHICITYDHGNLTAELSSSRKQTRIIRDYQICECTDMSYDRVAGSRSSSSFGYDTQAREDVIHEEIEMPF